MPEPDPSTVVLPIAQVVPVTEAEGPGRRFALWFQGCPLRCAGCCNPEMLPFSGGVPTGLDEVLAGIDAGRDRIEGITLLGGEPFAHAAVAVPLAKKVHEWNLSVMIFSGFTLEELRASAEDATQALLAETDILVDGPYRRDMPESTRRWIGSSNQRVHFLSPRCDPHDSRWLLPNTLEIRLERGELTVNGFPARGAVGLWKKPVPARSDEPRSDERS